MSETDYEQLYHLMSRRRGEELRQMEAFREAYTALLDTFIETDRQLSDCAERQSEPVIRLVSGGETRKLGLEDQLDAFLWRLDHRYHLKRAIAAKAALRILLHEGEQLGSMGVLYQKTAEVIGGTKTKVERNLRSYRLAVKEAGTDFYYANLAECNTDNAEFYWNLLRLFKQEMR